MPEAPLELPARPGQRKLADLIVREQRAALWLTVDGEHLVVFDYSRFGNWDRNDLASGEYWPTTKEVAAEATWAAGYALDAWDWGPCPEAPLLWEIVLDVKRTGDHPERWRLNRLEWMPDRWSRPLKQHGVTSFGDLISRLEAGTFSLDQVKAAPRKPLEPFASPLAEFVSLLRDFWEKHTIEGERGNFPAWLPRPIDLPPVFSAPKKSKRKGGGE